MADIKILSVNVQGIGLLPKRTDILHYLKEKNCQIYCLQDTHFSPGILRQDGMETAFSAP